MTKRKKTFAPAAGVFTALLLLAAMLLLLVTPVLAVSQAEIDALQEQRELLAAQAEELQQRIDALTDQRGLFIQRKVALDQQISINQQEIQLIGAQIEIYDAMIQEKEKELDDALAAENAQSEQLRSRMRAMEENGTLSYVSFLFEASSLTDLLSRVADISDIMHYDQALEEEYMTARSDVEAIKADYEQIRTVQESVKKELDNKRAQLDAQVEAAYTMIANISALSDDVQADYDAIDEEEEKVQSEINDLLAKLAAEEAARAAAAGGGSGGGGSGSGGGGGYTPSTVVNLGSLTWPTPSCTMITSRFGYRTSPTAGASSYHRGLDIGAAEGASILAASGGTVETATYSSSYGNYALVNHGGGVVTIYAHMTSLAVSAGQYVSQGQLLGYVGSTGISTGPHLHFEVRINGENVDPSAYFSGLTYYNC